MPGDVPSRIQPLRPHDPERLGDFHLLGRLGQGGMGVVYLGRDDGSHLAAVKLIREEYTEDPEAMVRFRREAKLGARLRARCIARVLDFQVATPPVWLASEYVQGPSLRQRRRSAGALSARQVTALALGTAEALTAIHAAGIVHRDLHDANVILAPDGPRVIDFGIARAVDAAKLTATGDLLGTPNWISPERWDGKPGGPHSDVFAWAVTVVTAATGTVPFDAEEALRVRHRILTETPDLEALPDPVREVVAAALDRDPGRRPSATELCARLVSTAATATPEDLAIRTDASLRRDWDLHDPSHDLLLPSRPLRTHSPSTAKRRTADTVPPFAFRQQLFHDPVELATAMSDDVEGAVAFFTNDTERELLRDWLIDDFGDTSMERGVLRRRITFRDDARRMVTRFVTHFRPDRVPVEPDPEALAADEAARLDAAEEAHRAGGHQRAAQLCTPLAEGGNARAMNLMGLWADRAGDAGQAERWWRTAAEAGHTGAMHNLGVLLEQRDQDHEAQRWWRAAAEAGHAGAMYNLGILLKQREQDQDAEEWWRAAAEAGNTGAMYNLGMLYVDHGRHEDAEHWYDRAAKDGDTDAMNNLADLLNQRGAVGDAEGWYRRAAEAGVTDAMYNLGVLLTQRGAGTEAERWWRAAAEAGDAGAAFCLGVACAEQGRHEDAERWYRRAADAGDHRAMTGLGLLLCAQDRVVEAERWFHRAIDAGDVDAVTGLAVLRFDQGRPDEAEHWYRRAAEAGVTDAMYNLGVLLNRRRRTAEAEHWWRRAADAGDTGAMDSLAELLEHQDRFEEAERWRRAGG